MIENLSFFASGRTPTKTVVHETTCGLVDRITIHFSSDDDSEEKHYKLFPAMAGNSPMAQHGLSGEIVPLTGDDVAIANALME